MRYSKIYVVNPPSLPGYVSNKDSMGRFGQLYPTGAPLFPPLDLIYLAVADLASDWLAQISFRLGSLWLQRMRLESGRS